MDKEFIYCVFCGSLNLIERRFSRRSRAVLSCFVSERAHTLFLSKGLTRFLFIYLPSLIPNIFCANKISLKENNRENAFLFIYAASRSSYVLCIFGCKLLVDVWLKFLICQFRKQIFTVCEHVKIYFRVGLILGFFQAPLLGFLDPLIGRHLMPF